MAKSPQTWSRVGSDLSFQNYFDFVFQLKMHERRFVHVQSLTVVKLSIFLYQDLHF